MQIEKRLKNHYKRWNITSSYEEDFLKFKHRLIEIINEHLGDYLVKNSDIDKQFQSYCELASPSKSSVKKADPIYREDDVLRNPNIFLKAFAPVSYTPPGFGDTNIYKSLNTCESLQKLATVVQIMLWALEVRFDEIEEVLLEITRKIRRISILTPSTNFVIHKRKNQFIVYPSGDQFLDQGIIDCTLSGLEAYPRSSKAFEKALKLYLSGEASQYRNLLDELRFSFEQLLKIILNNNKSLEKQKEALLQWLNNHGLHDGTVKLYQTLMAHYLYYQNDAVKHNEAFSTDEIEFMIYLTGNFMRLITQLASRIEDNDQ